MCVVNIRLVDVMWEHAGWPPVETPVQVCRVKMRVHTDEGHRDEDSSTVQFGYGAETDVPYQRALDVRNTFAVGQREFAFAETLHEEACPI